MKILFLTHRFYPFVGGIEVNSEILATAFQNNGNEVTLVTWTANSENDNYPFRVVREPSIFQLIKLHKWSDVVYENNPTLQLSWVGIFFKKPSIIALRTWLTRIDESIGWQDRLKQYWLKRANAVIAISESVRKKSFLNAVVIGNPYRETLFRKTKASVSENNFVFIGRLVSDKGADLAIQAVAEIVKSNEFELTTPILTIIGVGDEKNSLKELVLKSGLNDKVVFTGLLKGDTLTTELNKHKYLLVPSRWEEPFGNVALEGLACGCIPIVSDGGGLPDAVGNAGIVFKRNDLTDLIYYIRNLLNNKALQEDLVRNASIHLENHKPDYVASKYLEVIYQAYNSTN